MRRLAAVTALLLAGMAAIVVLRATAAQGSSSATFAVIFDDARGLIPGQLVKIAGAQAGTITNVSVIKVGSGARTTFRARIVGTVGSQFMPFHTNASCTIKPQGLIAENFVECDPGSPPAPVLRGAHGNPPTVPVANTTEPVSLLDLFNIFNLPTRERVAMLINELGIGTAARGQDFNAILYRANPALALARQVIGILARQKDQLAAILDATNTIAQQAATHTAAAQQFIDRAASLASTTAAHRSSLQLAIQRLPGLLAAAQPSLQQLDVVARDGTPLLAQLHAAVPALNRVATDLGPFVAAAKPGLAHLSTALDKAIPAIRDVTPLVGTLRSYTHRSLPKTKLSGRLFTSLQDSGFLENFLGVMYYVGAALSRYDSNSHLLEIALEDIQNGACLTYATTPVPGCSANYGSSSASASSAAPAKSASGPSRSSLSAASRSSAPPSPSALRGLRLRPLAPTPVQQSLRGLIGYLLR
jgi:ABC-type transporter Mla subunit MlaD